MPARLLIALTLLCTALSGPSWSQTKPFGLGIIAGEPTGGTVKIWFNPYFGIDLAAGADFGPYSHNPFYYRLPAAFQAHTDFLVHVPLVHTNHMRLPLYIGVGPQFGLWRQDGDFERHWRVRTPIGLALLTPRPPFPWELFVEFAPTWARQPDVFDPDFAAGVRYYF